MSQSELDRAVERFGAALSVFVAATAYRIALSPLAQVGDDERQAFEDVKDALRDAIMAAEPWQA